MLYVVNVASPLLTTFVARLVLDQHLSKFLRDVDCAFSIYNQSYHFAVAGSKALKLGWMEIVEGF